ncbi:MAG: NAD(P)H-dependent oxidoreductase [Gracilibacteraceae bacterium]|jgi:multimeric flavodoxin WrbA|nr:NAD(P)H-dependent oxidoreductase [Gracilibacteraceae bacterium]
MKIVIVSGSPKGQGSASEKIAAALQSRLAPAADCAALHAAKHNREEIMAALAGCGALILVFPLYVDGIPSHLLRLLDETRSAIADAAPGLTVYCVVNNGFFEARQNALALELTRNFCDSSGLKWGQGLGVGAGGMIHAARVGHGPMKNLGKALDALAENILRGQTGEDRFAEPNFPKFLYNMIAHMSWRSQARKHGLKAGELRRGL